MKLFLAVLFVVCAFLLAQRGKDDSELKDLYTPFLEGNEQLSRVLCETH